MQENMPNTNKKGYEVKREFYDKGFKRKGNYRIAI